MPEFGSRAYYSRKAIDELESSVQGPTQELPEDLFLVLFFFASVQLFFIGIVGEYIGAIHTQVLKRPLVIEKERINFD